MFNCLIRIISTHQVSSGKCVSYLLSLEMCAVRKFDVNCLSVKMVPWDPGISQDYSDYKVGAGDLHRIMVLPSDPIGRRLVRFKPKTLYIRIFWKVWGKWRELNFWNRTQSVWAHFSSAGATAGCTSLFWLIQLLTLDCPRSRSTSHGA